MFSTFGIKSVVASFKDPFKVKRPATGEYDDNGIWVEQPAAVFSAKGSIQAASAKELLDVEEGRRTNGVLRIYTATKIFTASVKSKRQPDVLIIGDDEWLIEKVEDRFEFAGYYKVVTSKIGQ